MNTAAKNAVARKSRPRKSATNPEDTALAERLVATPTIPDKAWAPARGVVRNEGETREQFIRRVLLGEAS